MNPLPNSGGFCGLYFFRLNVFISSFNVVYLRIENDKWVYYEKSTTGSFVFFKRFDERHDECSSGHKRLHESSSEWH